LNITFINKEKDVSVGSYRIFVLQFINQLQLEESVQVFQDDKLNETTLSSDIVIFAKNSFELLDTFNGLRKKDKLVGLINPPLNKKYNHVNFVIVGSVLEKVYAQKYYKNVFVYDLIEDKYNNCELKVHKNSDEITLGTHGNHVHLHKFKNTFKLIDEWKTTKKIKFINITDDVKKSEQILRRLKLNYEIEHKKWEYKNFEKDLKQIDIGLINFMFSQKNFFNVFRFGKYKTDYNFRFKNKTNLGRAFVFYQLGIPLIHDLNPESFFINYSEEASLYYYSETTLLNSLEKLSEPENRNNLSRNANKKFKDLYLSKNISEEFISFLNNII